MEIGTLVKKDPREVWPHEAHDFTPWLFAHPEVLGEALGMDLRLEATEHPVGVFSLDLIGVDESTQERVIIENQLEFSDHGHLGQLMTYAAGAEATNIVWVARGFKEEHRAALDWLNSRTGEDTRFFAVTLSVVTIGDSMPAPLLEVVVRPNDWGKTVKESESKVSGKGLLYQEFWGQFLERVQAEHPDWTNAKKPTNASWMTMSVGTSSVWLALSFRKSGLSTELYFGSSDQNVNETQFSAAQDRKAEFEAAFGGPLNWDLLPNNKASRIIAYADAPGIEDVEAWSAYLEWFIDQVTRFRHALKVIGGVTAFVS